MEIIKNNNLLNVTCPECRSELLLEFTDVKITSFRNRLQFGCKCEACGEKIRLEDYWDKMPKRWRDTLRYQKL